MAVSTDNSLMIRVKSGEIDKLSLLFERYKKPLFGYFYRILHDKEASEDLVQNVFFRILKYRTNFTGSGMFKNWMYRIAHNVSMDHYRKNRFHKKTESITDSNSVETKTTENSGVENEEYQHLSKAIQLLDDEEREILVLSKYQGLKYKEIGEILGCAEGTVKTRVFRAVMSLKHNYFKLEE
jgi:RNA polymerase sigma-70 factor (ECF subfamily)